MQVPDDALPDPLIGVFGANVDAAVKIGLVLRTIGIYDQKCDGFVGGELRRFAMFFRTMTKRIGFPFWCVADDISGFAVTSEISLVTYLDRCGLSVRRPR